MNISYIILAHKAPEQLERLVSRLQGQETSFFIHVDKRASPSVAEPMLGLAKRFPRVQMLPRHECNWGGFSLVEATIEGIHAVASQRVPSDWTILLSGQDYPLKSNAEIARFLNESDYQAFMEYFQLPNPKWGGGGLNRIEGWQFNVANRSLTFPPKPNTWQWLHRYIKRKFPPGFVPYGGSQFWGMSGACVEYVSQFIKSHPVFLQFFEHVLVPDEIFFQTIIMNSHLRTAVVNDSLRYTDWTDRNSAHPKTLQKEDLPDLIRSAKLFARKFDAAVDARVLDDIDSRRSATDDIAPHSLHSQTRCDIEWRDSSLSREEEC